MTRKYVKRIPPKPPLVIYLISDDNGGRYRVWRNDRPGDVFDLIPYGLSEGLVYYANANPDLFHFGDPPDNE